MKKQTLIRVLDAHKDDHYHFTKDREYHEPEEIMDVVNATIRDYDYPTDDITDIDDIRDNLNEQADSATPTYNHKLAEWFSREWPAYDEVAEEFGRDGMGNDIMQGIGIAYCITLEREASDALQAVWNEAKASECPHPIEQNWDNKCADCGAPVPTSN